MSKPPETGHTETEDKPKLRVLEILLPRDEDEGILHQAVARALPGRSLASPSRIRQDERVQAEHLRWTLETQGDHRSEVAALRSALGSRSSKAKIRAHICNHAEGLSCGPWEDL